MAEPCSEDEAGVVVGALGTAQTLGWESSYYLPAILANPIADGLGVESGILAGRYLSRPSGRTLGARSL
jgi:hypothetical protein